MVAMRDIREVCRAIVDRFKPERIVLFGSHAWGRPTEDSDVDLLVLLPHNGRSLDKSVEIRLAVRPPFPMDMLVRTPQKVRQRLAMGDTFMRDILSRGKVLYEADDA